MRMADDLLKLLILLMNWSEAIRTPSAVKGGSPCAFTDRKSTRLNSSHSQISYAVFCLKKKERRDATAPVYCDGGKGNNRKRSPAPRAGRAGRRTHTAHRPCPLLAPAGPSRHCSPTTRL